MPRNVRLLIAMGTRKIVASNAHQATRRARLMASSGALDDDLEAASAPGADAPGACSVVACLVVVFVRVASVRAACSRDACSRAAWLRAACRRAARWFLLALAKRSLPYRAPRPVSTTRKVSATICASMARF